MSYLVALAAMGTLAGTVAGLILFTAGAIGPWDMTLFVAVGLLAGALRGVVVGRRPERGPERLSSATRPAGRGRT